MGPSIHGLDCDGLGEGEPPIVHSGLQSIVCGAMKPLADKAN